MVCTTLMHCLNLNNILRNQQKPIALKYLNLKLMPSRAWSAILRYYVMEKVGLSSSREEILSKPNINELKDD